MNKNLENLEFIEEPSSVESSSTDCKSELPISKDSNENKSLRQFCGLYPNKLKIAIVNTNPIRNDLDLLSDQVKGSVDILELTELYGQDRNYRVARQRRKEKLQIIFPELNFFPIAKIYHKLLL